MPDTATSKSALRQRLLAERVAASSARPQAADRLAAHFAPNWRPHKG